MEGSLRAGNVHEDANDLLRDNAGKAYSYTTSSNYLGFHVGVGKEYKLRDGNLLDVYGKYFYNRRNSSDFMVDGDEYHLDAITSSVLRLGTRYTMKRDTWSLYGGIAYEHELDGKARGHVNGLDISAADTSGGSFRGEIGVTFRPDDSPLTLNLNLTGYAGKKKGLSGGLSAAWHF